MVGVTIRFKPESKNIFRVLFKDLDVSKWYFSMTWWESYGKNTLSVDFNELEIIPSEMVKNELILQDNQVIPEFIELYISFDKIETCEIETYRDFIHSNFSLSLIIIDHRNIEICCKDENILNKIISNFQNSSLEIITFNELHCIKPDAKLRAYRSRNDINIYD